MIFRQYFIESADLVSFHPKIGSFCTILCPKFIALFPYSLLRQILFTIRLQIIRINAFPPDKEYKWSEYFSEDSSLLCTLDRMFDNATEFLLNCGSYWEKNLETIINLEADKRCVVIAPQCNKIILINLSGALAISF